MTGAQEKALERLAKRYSNVNVVNEADGVLYVKWLERRAKVEGLTQDRLIRATIHPEGRVGTWV